MIKKLLKLIFNQKDQENIKEMDSLPVKYDIDVLVLADLHSLIIREEEYIQKELINTPDIILILGDITYQNLSFIFSLYEQCKVPATVPIIGVLGNHDGMDLYDSFPMIEHLDGKYRTLEIKGHTISIAGLSGSVKYKNSDYCLKTQKESVDILDNIPACDLLITHDKPLFDRPSEEDYDGLCKDAHCGLYGIGKYIMEKKPSLVLHGHIHKPSISRYKDTYIRCCYGIERFKI